MRGLIGWRPWRSAGAVALLTLAAVFAIGLRYAGRASATAPESAPAVHAPAPATLRQASTSALDPVPDMQWTTFTVRDGLPSDHVFAVRVDGNRVWAGTTEGLGLFENGRWTRYGTADGLPHRVVLSLDVSPRTGDLWIGTVGGLARFSAGRFDTYTQTSSGLSNDFVHAVRCDPDEDAVWAATAMGANRLDLRTGQWSIFTHENTPMHEPWTYSLAIGNGSVYVGAWGGGVLQYTKATGRWREFRDPDGQFELDVFPDDGPVSDVTSAVDAGEGLLWAATYFGLARYDGREWQAYFAKDSGLASDFINFVRAQGRFAWLATDQGLSVTDGDEWITYRRLADGRGEVLLFDGGRKVERRLSATAPAHNYVLGVDVAPDEVWLATERGVSRGVRTAGAQPFRRDPTPDVEAARADNVPANKRFRYAGVPEALLPFRGKPVYHDFFTERSQFRGEGRNEPEPAGLSEVRIGFIGPLEDSDIPSRPPGVRSATRGSPKALIGRRMLRAAELAVDEANALGGLRGIPFRIVPRTDLVLWGQSSNELVHFSLDDRVWAVLTSLDSNHNHVMSRATLKLELPIVSAGSTDPTLVEHAIPWLVRCTKDDRQGAYALLNEIFRVRGLRRVAVLRVNDRDGRVGIGELVKGARRLGHPIPIEQRFSNGDVDFRTQIAKIMETSPDALALWGNPEETGRIVRQVRGMGIAAPIFGFDRMNQAAFLQAAGPSAEGVVLSATVNADSTAPAWLRFQQSYRARWGEAPDSFAAHAYDGANLIIEAMRKAGLNRARIRDRLFDLRRYEGVAGTIVFDTNMSDIGPTWLAVVKDGRFTYQPAPAWPPGGAE